MIVVVLFPIQPDLDLENHIYYVLQIWCVGLFVLLTLTWPDRGTAAGCLIQIWASLHAPPSHRTKPTHLKGAQHNILCDREITFTTFMHYFIK